MSATSIEWTNVTWNPVTGCSKVSPGCAHCYAETVAERFWATQYPPVEECFRDHGGAMASIGRPRRFTDVQCHPERLEEPLRWRKPRRVFANSMSDLFHEAVPDTFIAAVFGVMAAAPQHTYQVLTKRPARMRAWFNWIAARHSEPWTEAHAQALALDESGVIHRRSGGDPNRPWPLPNVWLGCSVENQHFADERIPLLLETPAAIRFVSYEPALGPIDFARWLPCPPGLRSSNVCVCHHPGGLHGFGSYKGEGRCTMSCNCRRFVPQTSVTDGWDLSWVIVGGESGPKARPCQVDWIRSVVQQCRAAGVPIFVKQLGAAPLDWSHAETTGRFRTDPETGTRQIEVVTQRPRDRKGGDPSEWPEDLRVREWPEVRR